MPSDKRHTPPSKSRRPMCSITGRTRLLALDPFVAITSRTCFRTVRRSGARRGSSVKGSKAAKLSWLLSHAPQRSACYDITSHLSRSHLRSNSLELQASSFLGLVFSKHFEDRDGISLSERQFLRPGRHRLPRRFRFYYLLRGNNFINSSVRIIYSAGAMAFLATQRPVMRCHWASPLVFKSSEFCNGQQTISSVLTLLEGLNSSLR